MMDGFTNAERVASLGNTSIRVRLHSTPGCGVLTGTFVAPLVGNTATFTDLSIRGGGMGYIMRFCVEPCRDNVFLLTDDVFSDELSMRPAVLKVEKQPAGCHSRKQCLVQPTVRIFKVDHDRMGNFYHVTDREYRFSITASFNMPGVTLYGRRTIWPTGGYAQWTDLRLDISGYAERGANLRLIFSSCYGEPECNADGGLIDDQMASAVSNKFDVEHGIANSLLILQHPVDTFSGQVIGATCTQYLGPICVKTELRRPPRIQVVDVSKNVVLTGNWFACVRLQKNSSFTDINYYMKSLRGDAQVKVSDGVAVFTNLYVELTGQGFFFNFSVYSGVASARQNCERQADLAFTTAMSSKFNIDSSFSSQIIVLNSPGSQIGEQGYRKDGDGVSRKEEVLTTQPTVAFADPYGNVMPIAHCGSNNPDLCNLKIGVGIYNVSNEDSLWEDPSGYVYSGDLQCNFFQRIMVTTWSALDPLPPRRCTHMYQEIYALPKHGVVAFTDLALLRVGTYVLQFFSGTLTVNSEPFYVASAQASEVCTHISPGASSCKYASPECSKGGTLTPQPVFKVRDKWKNLAQDGSFRVRVSCKNLVPQDKEALTCGSCIKRELSDSSECLSCDAYSSRGYVSFTDIAVIYMRADLVLQATLPDLTPADIRLMGAYDPDYEPKAETIAFDTFGVQSIVFNNRPEPTPSGCAIFPPPTISLMGYSPRAPEDAQIMTPIAQGLADVFAIKCTEHKPDIQVTVNGAAYLIPNRVSVTALVIGKFERDHVSQGTYFNEKPYYKGVQGELYETNDDGVLQAMGENENYYLYYCHENSTRNFFGRGDTVPESGKSFWALGVEAHYCEDGVAGVRDYPVGKAFYRTFDSAFLPTRIVMEWTKLIRKSEPSAPDRSQLGAYAILFQKVTPACTIDNTLYGATSIQIVRGAAVFSDLRLDGVGTYNLRFNLRLFGSEAAQSMDVLHRIIPKKVARPEIVEDPYNIAMGNLLYIRAKFQDTSARPIGVQIGDWVCTKLSCRTSDGLYKAMLEVWQGVPDADPNDEIETNYGGLTRLALADETASMTDPLKSPGELTFAFSVSEVASVAFVKVTVIFEEACGGPPIEKEQYAESLTFTIDSGVPSAIRVLSFSPGENALFNPFIGVYAGEQFTFSVISEDNLGIPVNQGIDIYIDVYECTNECRSTSSTYVRRNTSEVKLYSQCGSPRVLETQSLDGVNTAMQGLCRDYEPSLRAVGVANFTELTFRKAGYFKLQFRLGEPWDVVSDLTKAIWVKAQDMTLFPWYGLRFDKDALPPISVVAGTYFVPQPIIELVDQFGNPITTLQTLQLYDLKLIAYLKDTDPPLVRRTIWDPVHVMMILGRYSVADRGFQYRVALTTMGQESVYWAAGSPMCSEDQIFRVTAEVRREVSGVYRKRTLVLDSLPIHITPGKPRPNGFAVLIEPIVSNAVSDFLVPPVIRVIDNFGNPYCSEHATTVFMQFCNRFGAGCDEYDPIGASELVYAEAQFTDVRIPCAGRWRIRYSAEIEPQYTVQYLSSAEVVIEPGPVHSFSLYEPIETSVAYEPLKAVKLALRDQSPCQNLATEVVLIGVSLELVSRGENPELDSKMLDLEGELFEVSGGGLAVFSDLRIVPHSSPRYPFTCRLIFHRDGISIGKTNDFEVRVVTSMRLNASPTLLDATNIVGKEIMGAGGEIVTVELLDVYNHSVEQSSAPVVVKLQGDFNLSCAGEVNTINGLPCSFNDTVIVSDDCRGGQPEGHVCAGQTTSKKMAYCSYSVGKWACARCAVLPGSWSGSKRCTAVSATNGTARFRNLTTYETGERTHYHVLEFHYVNLVIYSDRFKVFWGDVFEWDVERLPGEAVAGKIFSVIVFFRDVYGNRIYFNETTSIMQFLPGDYTDSITTFSIFTGQKSNLVSSTLGAYQYEFNATKSMMKLLLNFTIRFPLEGAFHPQIPIGILPERPHRIVIGSESAVKGMVNAILYSSPHIFILDQWGNEVIGTYQATVQGIAADCTMRFPGINESVQDGVDANCATNSRGLLTSREACCSSNDQNQTICHLGAVPASTKVNGLVFGYHGLYRLLVRIFGHHGQYGRVDLAQTSFVIPIAPDLVLRFQDIPTVVAGEKLMHKAQSGVNIRMSSSQDSDKVVAVAHSVPISLLSPVTLSTPPTPKRRVGNSVLVSALKTWTIDGRPCMSTEVSGNAATSSSTTTSGTGSGTGLQCHAEDRLRNVLAGLVNIPYNCSSVEKGYGNVPNGTRCHFPFEFNGSLFTQCTRIARGNFAIGRSWCGTSHDVASDDWGECGSCVQSGLDHVSGSGRLTVFGDEVEYVMSEGTILFHASIVNVGTYRLYARTANFSDDDAVAGENIFFRQSLNYTWAAGHSREFNVTPGAASGLEILTEPGDCVLRNISDTYCEIATPPVVRLVDLFGNGIGDQTVTVDVIQLPVFPHFPVPPAALPDEFAIEKCNAFFSFASASCPVFLGNGESCRAPSSMEWSSICFEAFDPNSTCFKAISNQSAPNRNEVCTLFMQSCDAFGLLPSGPAGSENVASCFAARSAVDNRSASVPSGPLCLPGWSEADGSCFWFNSTGTSFAEAEEVCKALTASVFNPSVATISSMAMNDLVAELIGDNSEVFIGLTFRGFGGWSEGYGSLEWVSGFPLNFEADWVLGIKPDGWGKCTRIFGKHSNHSRAWGRHDCDFARQGFVCSYVPMTTRMGEFAVKTSEWWYGGTAVYHGLSIDNLADSMTPYHSLSPVHPTFKALIRFRCEPSNSGPIFYAGHHLHFVLAKKLNITSRQLPIALKAGQMLPRIDIVLIDLDGGLVKSTDTPVVASLHTRDGHPEHPMLGEKQITIQNGVATFQQLWVRKANNSVFIRFYYVDGMTVHTSSFAVVAEDPVQLSIIQQAPGAVTSNVKFHISVVLLDPYSNVCPIANAKVFSTSSGVDSYSLNKDTRNQIRCDARACSFNPLQAEPGKWLFDLFVKTAAPNIRLTFRVENRQSIFPFGDHAWWTSALVAVSDPFECVRGDLADLKILNGLQFSQIQAGVQLPPFKVRLTDAEGNEYDPSANASSHGTEYDPHQVGQRFLVHVLLQAEDGTLLTTSNVIHMDDNSRGTIFSGKVSYDVGKSEFEVSNLTIFRPGSYQVYLSINGSEIVQRTSKFAVYPAAADRLLFDTISGNMSHNIERTLDATAGETIFFAFHVVDIFGNFVYDLPDILRVAPIGQLSARAPWLEDPPVSSWIVGKTEAHAINGRFELQFSVQYAGRITLHFAYFQQMNSVDILVNSEMPFQISLATMPMSFKIDDANRAALPGLPYRAAVLDRFNNTVDAQRINLRLAETVSADAGAPKPCGDAPEPCKAELCLPNQEGECELRFEKFDTNQDREWSSDEFGKYSKEYPDVASTTSFESMDISGDGTICQKEFQAAGLNIMHQAPFFEIKQLILKRPNRYALIFSFQDILLQTESFDVLIGDPYQVQVATGCPKPSDGDCGRVGQYLKKSFHAEVVDAVGNLRDDLENVPIVVSIPSAFTTPGAFLLGNLFARTVKGKVVFRGESIRIDKVPPNPSIGYKLQFAAVMSNFSVSPGTSDFFRILTEEASTVGFVSQIDEGSTFYVFTPVGGESGAARIESRDRFGNLVEDTGETVFALLLKGDSIAPLQGTTAVRFTRGYANFDNLLVDESGENYRIKFCLTSPFSCPKSVVGNSFSIVALGFVAVTLEPRVWSYAGSAIPPDLQNWVTSPGSSQPQGLRVQILDRNRQSISTKINVVASIVGDETKSLLLGTTTEAAYDGVAQFTNLVLQRNGTYQIRFKVDARESQLETVSRAIKIIPSEESALCYRPSDCIINIVRDPFPVTCDGNEHIDELGNVLLSTDIIAGECFRSDVTVSDAYGNILEFGNVSAQARLDGHAQPGDQTWRQHLQQRRMLKFIASSGSRVLTFIFNIERSCSAADCSGERRQGYILEFYKEASTAHTKRFEILPGAASDFDFALMNFNALKGMDEIYAGDYISSGPPWVEGIDRPTFSLYDRFGNLATTQTGVFVWNVTYVGPGCMLCDKQVVARAGIQGNACEFVARGIGRTNSLNHSVSTCTDLVEPINGKMTISVSAPTLVVKDFQYNFFVELKSWDFGTNNLFTKVLTQRFDLLAGVPAEIAYDPLLFYNRVAGDVFKAPLAVTDRFGNTAITGCTKTELYSISKNSVLSTCAGCNQSWCDDCGYEIAEQESALESTHVSVVEVRVTKASEKDLQVSIAFFDACSSTQALIKLPSFPVDIRPAVASQLEIENVTQAVAGSIQSFGVRLLDKFNNLAQEFSLVATFETQVVDTESYPGCLYCTAIPPCDTMCNSLASFLSGAAVVEARIPNKVTRQLQLKLTALLPAYAEWPSVSISTATEKFEILPAPAASIDVLQSPGDDQWASFTRVEFLKFPVIRLQDRFGNIVGEHQQVALQLRQCGDSKFTYVPHVWPDDDILETPPASPPYSFTDTNGIVEFRNFTLTYQNKNKTAICDLIFSSLDDYSTAVLTVDLQVTPPTYPDGAPQCPCIDPWNYERRLLKLDGTEVTSTDQNCPWKSNWGQCYLSIYGVSYPPDSGISDRCAPADGLYTPFCQPDHENFVPDLGYCLEKWCWVDPFNCKDYGMRPTEWLNNYRMEVPSDYVPTGSDDPKTLLWWSSPTCGDISTYSGEVVDSIQVELQPLSQAEAGNAFAVQPTVSVLNQEKIVIRGQVLGIVASLCKPCPCPCERKEGMGWINATQCISREEQVLVDRILETRIVWKGEATGCYLNAPHILNNRASVKDGYAKFAGLTSLTAGRNFYLKFSVHEDTKIFNLEGVDIASSMTASTRTFEVKPCTARSLELSVDSVFPGLSNTGESFCNGKPCIVELLDAFGNLVPDELEVVATLEAVTDKEIAGITVSSRCKCTGLNRSPYGAVGTKDQLVGDYTLFQSADAVSDYGTYCARWDSDRKDCSSLWPTCEKGQWCCRPWCYVDKSCPGAAEDVLIKDLYISYDACSTDPFMDRSCKYENPGTCAARNPPAYVSPKVRLLGSTSIITSHGRAKFTDLSTTFPGKYTIMFTARTGADLLKKRIENFGVTPLYATKFRFLQDIESTTNAVQPPALQTPLESQPVLSLLDAFDNPVVTDRICTAVTATLYPESHVAIYGQSLNDTDPHCRLEKNPERNQLEQYCFITANAVHGTASFSALSVPGGAKDGLQLRFTTGCCDPEPENCYCADPVRPLQADASRPISSRVREPCVQVLSSTFSIFQNLNGVDAGVMFIIVPPAKFRAGEKINVQVAVESQGQRLLGTTFTAVISLNDDVDARATTQAKLDGSAANGEIRAESQNSVVSFQGLMIKNLAGGQRFRLAVNLLEQSSIFVFSQTFEVIAAKAAKMVVRDFPVVALTTETPLTATILLFDEYDNAANEPAVASISIVRSELAHGATDRMPIFGATTLPFDRSEAKFTDVSLRPVLIVATGTHRIRIKVDFGDESLPLLQEEHDLLVLPGRPATMKILKFNHDIAVWEPFVLDIMVLDGGGNSCHNLNQDDGYFVQATTTPDFLHSRPLDDRDVNNLNPCREYPVNGFVSFQTCRAVGTLPASAAPGYPRVLRFGIELISRGGVLSSYAADIRMMPPVANLATYSCVTRQNCDNYWPVQRSQQPLVCNCTPTMVLNNDGTSVPYDADYGKEMMMEPFFHFPRVHLLDSVGSLARLSGKPVRVKLSDEDSQCFDLMGISQVQAVNGIADFNQLGIRFIDARKKFLADTDPAYDPRKPAKDNYILCADRRSALLNKVMLTFEVLHLDSGMVNTFVQDPSSATWAVSLNDFSAKLAITGQVSDAIAGSIIRNPLRVSLHRDGNPNQLIEISTRGFKVRALQLDLQMNTTEEVALFGTLGTQFVWGSGLLDDLIIQKAGPFVIEVSSTAFQGLNDSTTLEILMTDAKFIQVSDFDHLQFETQPTTTLSRRPIATAVVMKDVYGNDIGCYFGDCPEIYPRTQNSFVSKFLTLHPQAAMRIATEVLQLDGSRTACADSSREPECGCATGFLFASVGLVESECFSIGRAGFNYSINFITAQKRFVSQPFDILAGELNILSIIREPPLKVEAGTIITPPILMELLDSCQNTIVDPLKDLVIYASAEPEDSGISPPFGRSQGSVRGKVEFFLAFTKMGPTKILFYACPTDGLGLKESSDADERLKLGCPQGGSAGWIKAETRQLTVDGQQQVGMLSMRTQPGGAVQGQTLLVQPEIELSDVFGNPVSESSETIFVRAVLATGGGCPGGACSNICDGSILHGKCWKFFNKRQTREQAKLDCEAWGGTLATISDEVENNHVSTLSFPFTSQMIRTCGIGILKA